MNPPRVSIPKVSVPKLIIPKQSTVRVPSVIKGSMTGGRLNPAAPKAQNMRSTIAFKKAKK